MSERTPMTQTLNITETRQQLSQLINRVFRRHTRVIVEKSGIPVAAIISAEDLERLTQLETERAERFKILDEIRARNQGLDPTQVEHDVAAEIDAMRQEQHRPATARSPR